MNFTRIDRDDVPPNGLDRSTPARGALGAGQDNTDPELIVEMSGERPCRPGEYRFDPRCGARERTNDGLRIVRHECDASTFEVVRGRARHVAI